MVRTHGVSALPLLLALAGCARAPAPSVLLTPQTRFGLGEGYGRGIVAANAQRMRFELATPPPGATSLPCVPILDANLNPKPDPSCASRAGPRESPPQPSGRAQRLAVDELGYWLLIVSDARTPADELKFRLQDFEAGELDDAEDTPLLVIMQLLPGVLVGGRTTNWAAYYVGFAEVLAHTR